MVSTLPGWTHVYPATHTPELMHWASHPRRPRPSLLRTPPEEWCISSHLLPSCKERRASSQKPGKVNAMLANSEGCARAVPGDQIMLHLGRRLTRRKRTYKPTNILVTPLFSGE